MIVNCRNGNNFILLGHINIYLNIFQILKTYGIQLAVGLVACELDTEGRRVLPFFIDQFVEINTDLSVN